MNKAFDAQLLLPPSEALERYFAAVTLAPPRLERVAIDDAFGRILGQPVEADGDYPNAPRSAMDGFAVRAASTPGTLRLAGGTPIASTPECDIEAGGAMRVPTGGVLPRGADAVVPIESARCERDLVRVDERVAAGDSVTPRGADMRAGESVLEKGRRIGAPEMGLLAALGIVDVPVYRRPVVAVLSSGDELIVPSQRPRAGEVRDSNRYALAGSLRALGAQPRHYPIVRDREGALEAALAQALDECDAAIVSGGSSVGDRDLTPAAVTALGTPGVVVHGLRVRPGKPTLLAALGEKPVLGLPGNPLSALVMLEAVAAPILAALVGAAPPSVEFDARLAEALHGRPGWTWYVPVRIAQGAAHPLPMRSFSSSLAARASGYVRVGDERHEYPAGASVRVRRFFAGGFL
ncbi:MAG TPA: molybdopterin molybdotransferase MoeA [Candidatus Tyrphobacter sp.]